MENYFSIEELTRSNTAKKLGINNNPPKEIISNLVELIELLNKIRTIYCKPIIVTSGYRCKELNKKVGGASNSQHLLGQAADIRSVAGTKKENKLLFELIQSMIIDGKIKVGQLIDEYDYSWIHISTINNINKVNQIIHIK